MSIFRIIMLSGGINIDSLPETQKIYYTATAKVTPASGTIGRVIANNYNNDTGEGVICFDSDVIKIGEKAFYNYDNLTSITIPNNVTEIGTYALGRCFNLKNITISDNVTTIANNAFTNASIKDVNVNITNLVKYCTNNTMRNIPGNKHLYIDNKEITELVIPDSVTTIGNSTFYNCSSLTSITIPNSVTEIGGEAFRGCSSLTSITIPDSVTSIEYGAFSGCSILPVIDNIRYADTYLIEAVDKSLTTYSIKPGTRFIGSSAFADCSSLTSITIGNSVTYIGEKAFEGCDALENVNVNITNLAEYCTNNVMYEISGNKHLYIDNAEITELTIPDSVTEIGVKAFEYCRSLTSITIPNGVTTIRERAFWCCSSLTGITVPSSVTSIGKQAFESCPGELIVNCNIPSASSSTSGAFYGSKFTSAIIGNGVTSIGSYAFYGCQDLSSVTIPESVTMMRDQAFYNCYNLTTIYCKAITPPKGGYNMFYNRSDRSIYVPTESVDAYKSASYWSNYADTIVGYDFENNVPA